MNRIQIDNNKVLLNKDGAYLINTAKDNIIVDVINANVNILNLSLVSNIILNINNSKVIYNYISFDNNVNTIINLDSNESECEVYNSVVCLKKDSNVNYKVNHNSNNTISNIYCSSVTKNNSSCKIKVISKVSKGIKGCLVNQVSKIISLNEKNENKIEPILLIDEFDTKASHSCFIGKFNDNELFYLQSRGLSKKDSYKLLLNGFLIGVMKISDEEKKEISKKFLS